MEAIKFEKVHFSYEADRETKDVFAEDTRFSLDGVDFSVEEGEFVAVLGHNGSGKSTLARLIDGLLSPTSGKITVLGLDAGEEKSLFDIRKQVGIVFQNPDNQTVATIVEDDIAFGPENIGVPRAEIGERITFALNAVGMSAYRHATTTRLSGGQKQRVAIAGVLALKPKIMILDEATAMLDPRGRKEVIDVVRRLNKEENITVLLITHFPEEALLADRAIVMHKGAIVMEGKPADVLGREEELQKCALTLPKAMKISRALGRFGLDVADSLTESTLAENIEKALRTADSSHIEIPQTRGACTRLKSVSSDGRILCKDLRYVYNSNSPFATFALNGVTVEIPAGEFFGILGHTGSGKSTFVQHLNALIKLPTAEKKYKVKKGKALPQTVLNVGKFDLTDKKTDFKALRLSVGMVFQYPEYQLFAETVFEDVAFGLKNFFEEMTEEETEKAVREAIEAVGLVYEEVKDKSPFDLSGGQKRRVAIAGVIVTKPKILVLDEPAAGLDPLGKEEILSLLHSLHESWCETVIIVSHDMDEIAENCTRVAVFSEGKIVAVGSPKCVFSSAEVINTAGLDVPFTQKTARILKEKGIAFDCDLTLADFVQKTLAFAKTAGAGTYRKQGGGEHA
ncbi:MAG: energy-coupling factor transporter ATPase [Clostridia bacterium]|nr:energy-coupling factor transporter ATPase [Clostridia bacterium]